MFSLKLNSNLPPTFSASYHPNHTDFPLFRKVPVCTTDIIARCVPRRRQRLNHTRFWQARMEMLEGATDKAAPSLRLPDYMVHTAPRPPPWTLADEASAAHPAAPVTQKPLPRLYRVYSGRSCSVRCAFFFFLSFFFSVSSIQHS